MESSTTQGWLNYQEKCTRTMAAQGEDLVPPEVTLADKVGETLEDAKIKVAGVAAAGVTIATLGNAAPVAAETHAPAPIVRVMGASVSVGPAPEAVKPVEQKLAGQYVIERGDNLSLVAGKLRVPLSHLKESNKDDMPKPDLIFKGQVADYDPAKVVDKPEPVQPQVPQEGMQEITIIRGDTLSELAETYSDKVDAIAMRNGISNIHLIYADKKLTVLGGEPNKVAAASVTETLAAAPVAPAPQPEVAPAAPPAAELTTVTEPTILTPNPEPAPPADLPNPPDFVQPYPFDPPTSEAAPAPKPPEIILLERLHLDKIPDLMVDSKVIHAKDSVNFATDLIRDHKFCDRCAADFMANIYWESAGDPNATGDNGKARGLIMAQGDRQKGMPSDFHDQVHWTFDEARRSGRAPRLLDFLDSTSPGSADVQETMDRRHQFKLWEGWGREGNRWEISDIIFNAMHDKPLPQSSHILRPGAAPTFRAAASAPAPPAAPALEAPVPEPARQSGEAAPIGAILQAAAAEVRVDIAPSIRQDRQGYVQMHEDPEKRYVFYAGPEDRWGTAELVGTLQQGSIAFNALSPGMQTHIGDLNEKQHGEHVSHATGVDVDFYALGPGGAVFNMERKGYNYKLTIEYGKILLLTGNVKLIIFDDKRVISALNEFARANNLPGEVIWAKNHKDHGHLRVNGPVGPRIR